MKKRILLAGASGMVGSQILKLALASNEIFEIISLVRIPSGLKHNKLKEYPIQDFTNFSTHKTLFQNIDSAYFCIGVYTGQFPDDIFKRITVDYAVEFAKVLYNESPNSKLCLLSGAGADRTEKSKTAFARFKGMAENQISKMEIDFYSFRPGYIYPISARKEPNLMYSISRALYPLIKLFGSSYSITDHKLAEAMFNVGQNGNELKILENKNIVALAKT